MAVLQMWFVFAPLCFHGLCAGSGAVKCQVGCFGAVHGKGAVRRQLTFHCVYGNSSEKLGEWGPAVDSLKISLLLDC